MTYAWLFGTSANLNYMTDEYSSNLHANREFYMQGLSVQCVGMVGTRVCACPSTEFERQ